MASLDAEKDYEEKQTVADLEFEKAAVLGDKMVVLEKQELQVRDG